MSSPLFFLMAFDVFDIDSRDEQERACASVGAVSGAPSAAAGTNSSCGGRARRLTQEEYRRGKMSSVLTGGSMGSDALTGCLCM